LSSDQRQVPFGKYYRIIVATHYLFVICRLSSSLEK
jgi:hypothetical protein